MQKMTISTKLSILMAIVGITLGYSLYFKKKTSKYFENQNALILKTLPEFNLIDVYTEKSFGPKDFFSENTSLGMVHFWATWCAPCEAELPDFIKLAKKFEEMNVNILLVAVRDDISKIKKFLKRFGEIPSNIRILHDESGDVSTRFGTVKVPETYLFDSRLNHINKYVGPQDWAFKGHIDRLNFYLKSQKTRQTD